MIRSLHPLLIVLIASSTFGDQTDRVAWMLNCQGCHGADANLANTDVPPLKNKVAKFLSVTGGREYLVRVPGVAMAPISSEAVASLTNWMLREFDPDHVPLGFEDYSAVEVDELRKTPYISQASAIRKQLIAKLALLELSTNQQDHKAELRPKTGSTYQ